MPRLFVAIDLPEEAKATLTGLCEEIPHAKRVGAEELHLTLRFIGEVDDRSFAVIKEALCRVSFTPFPLTLCGIGHFPPRRHPRVVWVGMERCDDLLRLQQDVELSLIDAGIPPDERPFSPHITLARCKEDVVPASVAAFEATHRDLACSPFQVKEFILYSSLLTGQGAIHTKERIYPCTPGTPA